MNLGKTDIPKLEEYCEKLNDMKGQLMYRRYDLLYQTTDT
ncbi:UNVERIFIED_CONTAM: transcriptional regulator, partial [Escherichia coli]